MQRLREVKRSYSKPADRNLPLLGFGGGAWELLSRETGPGPVTTILQAPVVGGTFPGTGAWTWEGGAITAFKLQRGQLEVQLQPRPAFNFLHPFPIPTGRGLSGLGTGEHGCTKQRAMLQQAVPQCSPGTETLFRRVMVPRASHGEDHKGVVRK